MKLVDTKGKDIACFRKERFGPGKRVHILVKNNGEEQVDKTQDIMHYFQDSGLRSLKVRFTDSCPSTDFLLFVLHGLFVKKL